MRRREFIAGLGGSAALPAPFRTGSLFAATVRDARLVEAERSPPRGPVASAPCSPDLE
jgi:hypothetical protein